jgi:hypothetical protein
VLVRWRRSGDRKARRAEVLVRRRGSGDRKARRAEVLVRRRGSGDALGRAWTAGRGVFGQRRTRRSGDGRRGRGGRCRAGAGERGSCRDPIAALSHGIGAAHGGHAAAARCRAGPARRTTSDRWGPLVGDF